MAIANVLKSLDIPVLGMPVYKTEDQFLPPIISGTIGNEKSNLPQEIIICCKGKRRRVCGYLSEGVKLTGTSEWEDITSTSGVSTLSELGTTVNKLGQIGLAANTKGNSTAGSVLQQPWLGRKFWKRSKPFELSFSFNFVAETSALYDVFTPAETLLSFCYPRMVNNVEVVNALKSTLSGLNGGGTNTQGGSTVIGGLAQTMKTFAIPGPSLMYDGKNQKDNGDAVSIVVGNMLAFGACYLKTVSLEFSPYIDYSGYPVWCKCSITAEAMDSNYCQPDGSFSINQWADSANDISGLLDGIRQTINDAAVNTMNIAKATVNAISAFGQIFED